MLRTRVRLASHPALLPSVPSHHRPLPRTCSCTLNLSLTIESSKPPEICLKRDKLKLTLHFICTGAVFSGLPPNRMFCWLRSFSTKLNFNGVNFLLLVFRHGRRHRVWIHFQWPRPVLLVCSCEGRRSRQGRDGVGNATRAGPRTALRDAVRGRAASVRCGVARCVRRPRAILCP